MATGIYQIQNLQQIEAAIAGPEGANRLIIITGQVRTMFNVSAQVGGELQQTKEAFSVLIGPVLTRQQFFRAIGTASVSKINVDAQPGTAAVAFGWEISGIDADRDDESGQVELRFDLFAMISGKGNIISTDIVNFHVTILAAVSA